MGKAKPFRTYVAGNVRATVWENTSRRNGEGSGTDGESRTFYNIVIERSFKRSDDADWESSNSFGVRDLPKVQVVVQAAMQDLMVEIKE